MKNEMDINDVLGIGKILPIDKLVDLFSKSVGRLSKPYFDRKDIDTKSYEIKKLAEARAEEMKIISWALTDTSATTNQIEYKDEKISITSKSLERQIAPTLTSLNKSAQQRIEFQNLRAQLNLESIAAFAADDLKNEDSVSEEPVEEDWATRFFKYAEDISNEKMQALWGKILAGEIKRPKSFSLRTLELLRNLSKDEASLFTRAANLAISKFGISFLYKGENEDLLGKNGLHFSDITYLVEIGLLQPGDITNYNFKSVDRATNVFFTSGNTIIFVTREVNAPEVGLGVNIFSKSGAELLPLIVQSPPFEYLKEFAISLAKTTRTTVQYAHILGRTETEIQYTQPLQDF